MNLTYRQFAAQRHVPPFDWSTDGCTPPTPSAWATVFRPACVMHDFGYRNYGGGLRLDPGEERRAWVDRRFLEEMRRVCADRPSEPGFDCAGAAQTMYTAVRSFGSTAWYGTPSRASGQQGPE
ncbi:phospholipase [Streptomyces sp. UNOB3_S3]|nr:phospholipase [Streptomyces sp. UNOB3_S3]